MKVRKLIGISVAGMMLVVGSNAYADDHEFKILPIQLDQLEKTNENSLTEEPITLWLAEDDMKIEINGAEMELGSDLPYVTDEDVVMIPLRHVVEALGYEITWYPDTMSMDVVKDAMMTTLTINEDAYVVNGENMTLESIVALTEGTTFVPVSFLSQALQANVTTKDNGTISIEDMAQWVNKSGTITNIVEVNDVTQIHINGFQYGTVLIVTEETEIVSEAGDVLTIDDLELGMALQAEHSLATTMSIPPQTVANKVVVKETPEQAYIGTAGEITAVNESDEAEVQIVIDGQKIGENSYDEVKLDVTEDTEIINAADQKELTVQDLQKGVTVYAFYGIGVKESLPPIGVAEKIFVELHEEVEDDMEWVEKSGDITNIVQDKEVTKVHINGFQYGTVLIVTEDTEIITEEGNPLEIDDLQLGMNLDVEHSLAMTKSIPAQTVVNKIVVKETSEQAYIGTAGEITEIDESDEEVVQIVVKGKTGRKQL
ncbi:copper amine oxidase N-terminal domain-containing protein [Longirhabdus pacifica]|uniref:copper amine oxidase N-terminal domain-containing protein n=1 Tax=Longirhabdus pacifica TaxID=2305227 RepID=UPI0013E8BE04|nr:copper amine oxidase N-terminal domain-containing protein [Longirhabdus pacifica]